MKHIKYLIFFLVISFFCNKTYSQVIVICDDFVIKDFCYKLNEATLSKTEMVCFKIRFDCKIKKEKNFFHIECLIDSVYPKNPIILNNIDISKVIKPNAFSFKILLKDLNGNQVFDSIISSINIKSKKIKFELPDDIGYIPYRIEIDVLKHLFFDKTPNIKKFFALLQTQSKQIDSLITIIENIDFDDILIMESNDIQIDEIEQFINANNFNEITDLLDDSNKVKKQYETLLLMIKTNRDKLNYFFANSPYIAFQKGNEYLEKEDSINAIKYFHKGCKENLFYLPVSNKYIEYFFYRDNVNEVQSLLKILSKYYFGNELNEKEFFDICYRKYNELIGRANSLNRKQNYNELQFSNCSYDIKKTYSESKKGMYDSYISVTKKAINKNLYDLAENYFVITMEFQKQNKEFIHFNYGIDELSTLLVTMKIKRINEAIKKKKIIEANNLFEKLKNFTDTFNISIATIDIYKEINLKLTKGFFEYYTTLAKKESNNNNYYKTIEALNKAISYGYNDDISASYKKCTEFLKNTLHTTSSQKDSLVLFTQNIEKSIDIHRTKNEEIFIDKNQQSNAKVYNYSLCETIIRKFNDYNQKANFYLIDKKYAFADMMYDSIISIYKGNTECEIEINEVIENKKKIEQFADYQKLIDSAKYYFNNKDYYNTIKNYDKAEFIYNKENMSDEFDSHIYLWDYIYYNNNELILSAVFYYSKHYKLEEAVKLLLKLKNNMQNTDLTKEAQEYFAKYYAEEELKKSLQYKLAKMLIDENDRFFKHFFKAYQREIKNRR